MNVLVFVDQHNGHIVKAAAEALTYGSKIAATTGGTCMAFAYGNADSSALSGLGDFGAAQVFHASDLGAFDPMSLAKAMAQKARDVNAGTIILPHDDNGKALAPCIAALLKAGVVAGAVALPDTQSGFLVRKAVFSGKAFSNSRITSDFKVVTLLPNSIPVEKTGGTAQLSTVSTGGTAFTHTKEFKQKSGEGVNLTEAELVVSAGRGLKGPENWGMVEELAKLLGAATACSRPVADIGWRPHHEHVGQTGIAVRPNLYIAIGISGAIQHLAGVNGSKVMVVINTDPEAPFFKAATYGVVGDAFEVVPRLIEAVKKFKSAA
jgi:electron transfer flavoprotein alpha subunit